MKDELLLVDTHAHICDASFENDRAAVLERAEKVGIKGIIAVSEDLQDAQKNLELAGRFAVIRPAAGLYPTHLDEKDFEVMTAFIRTHHRRLWAIGEVGLDFWITKEQKDRDRQQAFFLQFAQLALELDLPLNVHSRSSGRHAIKILLDSRATRVQMHAFDGKWSTARPAVEAGYYFSIPPSVVRSRQKQKLVKHLPLDRMLVETDSPVLGPDPNARNEPANLLIAIHAIADLKGVSEADVIKAVAKNTRDLYRLPSPGMQSKMENWAR